MKSKLYQTDELDLIPSTSGLYAWYYNYYENQSIRNFHNVYNYKLYDAKITAPLGQAYIGKLFKQPSKSIDKANIFNSELLEFISHQFAPPIYIGISKDLQERAKTHFEKLRKYIHSDLNFYDVDLEESHEINSDLIDTESESNIFAIRIGKALKGLSEKRLTNFTIKTIELEKNYSRSELLIIETILNHTFNPLFGKR